MQTLKQWLLPMAVVALGGVVAYDHLIPHRADHARPAGEPNGAVLGRAYAPVLAASLSDAWLVAADTLSKGKSVDEARAALAESWKKARIDAFTAKVAPAFAKVLPEGTEPKDDAQRAQVVALWRDFARGLKGGR